MHPNKTFRQETHEENVVFARQRGFGQLCVNGPGGPLVSHIPFLLDETRQLAALMRKMPKEE